MKAEIKEKKRHSANRQINRQTPRETEAPW